MTLLIATNLSAFMPLTIETYRDYNFISGEERARIEQEVKRPALVFVENDPLNWWEYGRFFSGNTPGLDGAIIYARDLGPAPNQRLQALYPDRHAYLWQKDDRTLLPLPANP